ncbi:rhamnan synthesis F family protein [Sphingomonas bacterium]|uniref:rhamnan synthesis F family protein n=1 Tax=Sphingomonas bacterium TaxID=1895847 RepID=UPI0015772579|nr:rhamnan synthesis F family protein [Sphingomonas bacterium]
MVSDCNPAFPHDSRAEAAHIAVILDGGLFDARAYAKRTGLDGSDAEAAAHYLDHGERDGVAPSGNFDPAFYAAIYADVAHGGGNLLVHYLAYGRHEGRYATLAALKRHADMLRRSRKVKLHRPADARASSPVEGLTLLEYNLAGGWRGGAGILEGFDDRFYHGAYEDVRRDGLPPAVHYLLVGYDEGRVARSEQVEDLAAMLRPHFDEAYYRGQQPDLPAASDPLVDYIVTGRHRGLDPSPDFSEESYLARYPDVAAADVDPYLHFIRMGRAEGRSGTAGPFTLEPGDQPHDANRPTIVVASHESSRTGAPLVALGVAQELARDNNLIILTGRPGPLSTDFRALATQLGTGMLTGRGYERLFRELSNAGDLDGAVLNSAETFHVVEGALHAGVPSVALVHEFAEYSDLRVRRVVGAADRVVFPASVVRESAFKEVSPIGRPNNTSIRHQGVLAGLPADPDASDLTDDDLDTLVGRRGSARIVLGAGQVQIRKGVDLFVQTASDVRHRYAGDFRFVWVGSHYDPLRDLGYSLYVRETLERLGLQDVVTFVPAQANLDAMFGRADVFYLPSRLDPFPNVALDAFGAGLPVVCFDRATGIAEEIAAGRATGAAVEYGSSGAAADAIVAYFGKPKGVADANRRLIEDEYGLADYSAFILDRLAEARGLARETDRVVSALDGAAVFNAGFHEGGRRSIGLGDRPLRRYVAGGLKGLSDRNPRPGFSDNLYRSRHRLHPGEGVVPLFDALSRGEIEPTTHECHLLEDEAPLTPFRGRTALHLHLHYSDLAFDFARRLANAVTCMDIIVTTDSDKKRREIEYAFTDYRRGDVRVHLLPNRGRDMGPLMTGIRDVLRDGGYEVIGHLHGKKGLTVLNEPTDTGNRWREHMVGLLMGDGRRMDQVVSLFNDASTGLVFAEDSNARGWTENLPLAETLAARMTPVPLLPAFPYFPLGAMFWARAQALEPFWSLDLTMADLPAEPLPRDGTILHAMERMLPAVCEGAGLRWCTVHARGAGW